jgi:hypothetical protein
MFRIIVLTVFILLTFSSFSQVKQFDKLEMLYAQQHYKFVVVKANRLLDKPDYDYSHLPKYYKSLGLFQLVQNERWFKRNKGALNEAVALFEDIKNSSDGMKIFNAHLFEVTDLKEDLYAWGEELRRTGRDEVANELKQILLTLFNRVPNVDIKENYIKPVKTIGDDLRSNIVAQAQKHIGVPYVWAGTSPKGFDCSGFTGFVMKENDIETPRRAQDQYKSSRKLKEKSVQKGDLIFFSNGAGISHVGIVISEMGEPIVMIHASSSKGIVITNVDNSDYWNKRIAGYGTYLN